MTKTLNYAAHHGLYLYHYGDYSDGVQYLFKFNNGFGASVVKNGSSYGNHRDLWEVAVIEFDDENEWDEVYYTDITDDVIGYLNDTMVNTLLDRIKNLDENGREEITIAESRRKVDDIKIRLTDDELNELLDRSEKLLKELGKINNITPNILYLCNREDPDCPKTHCDPEECSHTLNIKYAKNFKVDEKGAYWEVEHETEQD